MPVTFKERSSGFRKTHATKAIQDMQEASVWGEEHKAKLFSLIDKDQNGTLSRSQFDSVFSLVHETMHAERKIATAMSRRLKVLAVLAFLLSAFLGVSVASNAVITSYFVNMATTTSANNIGQSLEVRGTDGAIVKTAESTTSVPLGIAPLLSLATLSTVKNLMLTRSINASEPDGPSVRSFYTIVGFDQFDETSMTFHTVVGDDIVIADDIVVLVRKGAVYPACSSDVSCSSFTTTQIVDIPAKQEQLRLLMAMNTVGSARRRRLQAAKTHTHAQKYHRRRKLRARALRTSKAPKGSKAKPPPKEAPKGTKGMNDKPVPDVRTSKDSKMNEPCGKKKVPPNKKADKTEKIAAVINAGGNSDGTITEDDIDELLEEAPLCAVDSADGGTCPSECMATWGVDGEIGTDQTLGHICEFMRWEIPEQFEGGMHNSWVPLASRDNQEMGYSCRDFLCVQPAARLHADDALPYYDCRQCCFCSDPIPPHIEVESPIVDVPAPPSPPAPTSGTGTSEGFCLPTLHQGDNMCDASTAPYDPDAPDWACPFTGVTKVGCHDSLEMFTSYGIYAMIFPEQMPLPCQIDRASHWAGAGGNMDTPVSAHPNATYPNPCLNFLPDPNGQYFIPFADMNPDFVITNAMCVAAYECASHWLCDDAVVDHPPAFNWETQEFTELGTSENTKDYCEGCMNDQSGNFLQCSSLETWSPLPLWISQETTIPLLNWDTGENHGSWTGRQKVFVSPNP